MSEPKTMLITGATDGLGRALALRLAADGHQLVLHGRNAEKVATLADEIQWIPNSSKPVTVLADFSSLQQVKDLVRELPKLIDKLDVLVNNAGVGSGEPAGRQRSMSEDGIELRFAVNYLAGFVLTMGALPLLRDAGSGRIVNVASLGQAPIDFDDPMIEKRYSGERAYRQSKLAQITSGFVFAKVLGAQTTVNSLHPATYMPTKIVTANGNIPVDSLQSGEEATRRLAEDSSLAEVTGKFFNGRRESIANATAYDPGVQRRLWALSLELAEVQDFTA